MRAIVFDFDGVLVDSEPMHERALVDAFTALDLPARWTDWTRYIGHGDNEAIRRMLDDQGLRTDPDTIRRLREAKLVAMGAAIERAEAAAYPCAVGLVRAALERGPTGVCSGSRAAEVRPILEQLGLLEDLGAVVTADDVVRTKPDPSPYLLAAERLGEAPADCLAIEDTPVGAAAAIGAGYVVVGVAHTMTPDALRAAGVHEVVPTICNLTIDGLERVWRAARV